MRRADRLFQIVQLLRSRRSTTGQQLARELGVSKRTVYRDVRDLVYAGVPIRGEAGVGYRLDGRYELPPLTFSSEEIEGLVLGARIVQAWADPDLAQAVSSAMTKVEAVLPPPMRAVLLDTALFAPGFHRDGAVNRDIALLRRAINERRPLHFSYARADGTETERTVRPLGLYFWGKTWTLAAWCELRDDYRSFRPDRMHGLALRDHTFEVDGEISLEHYLSRVERRDPAGDGRRGEGYEPTRRGASEWRGESR